MTTPADPSKSKSDTAPVVGAASTAQSFELWLHRFWGRNRNAVYVLCGMVLAGIVIRGGWDYMSAQKEAEIGRDYAAATTPEMLKSFTATHEGKPLAGAAELRLADQAYAEDRGADAVSAYEKAAGLLPPGVFASRARLGLAMSKVQAGRASEGEAALKQLSGDSTEPKSVRAEAAYQLASLAAAAGRGDEVKRLAEQLVQIDPESPWSQRAFALEASLPAPAAAPAPNGGGVRLEKK